MLSELLKTTRSCRKFNTGMQIDDEKLSKIAESLRYVASAGNLQRIRVMTLGKEESKKAFSHVSLGGYLPAAQKPTPEVAPVAYIVLLTATETPDVNLSIDIGIAAEAMALSASEMSIGSCMIRNFDKEYFSSLCEGTGYLPNLVIALGFRVEEARIVDLEDSVKYYIDENGVNVVPKIKKSKIILKKFR